MQVGEQKFGSDVNLLVKVEKDTSPRILRKMRVEVMPEQLDLPDVELKFFIGPEFSESYRFNENIKKEGEKTDLEKRLSYFDLAENDYQFF